MDLNVILNDKEASCAFLNYEGKDKNYTISMQIYYAPNTSVTNDVMQRVKVTSNDNEIYKYIHRALGQFSRSRTKVTDTSRRYLYFRRVATRRTTDL